MMSVSVASGANVGGGPNGFNRRDCAESEGPAGCLKVTGKSPPLGRRPCRRFQHFRAVAGHDIVTALFDVEADGRWLCHSLPRDLFAGQHLS